MSEQLPIRLRAQEVCKILRCSRNHLYKLDQAGKLRKRNETARFVYWLSAEVLAYAQGLDPYAGQAEASQRCAAHA